MRVSMGLTDNRQMAKVLTINCQKRNIFTVNCQISKLMLAVKCLRYPQIRTKAIVLNGVKFCC